MVTRAPELDWLDGEVPRSEAFGDTYFSKAGGLAETGHVFLRGNGLPDRFEAREHFTIAEFGFGTGLNFLTTVAAWSQVPDRPALTFLSFELFPMTREQLTRALNVFPELEEFSRTLIDAWAPKSGWNRLDVAGANLVIGIGDARELIGDLRPDTIGGGGPDEPIEPVDAWYLDGFSPARNPELWDAALLQKASDLTASGGTLATYTAAGWVRRNLQAAGFLVEKTGGFAGKREMMVGRKP